MTLDVDGITVTAPPYWTEGVVVIDGHATRLHMIGLEDDRPDGEWPEVYWYANGWHSEPEA